MTASRPKAFLTINKTNKKESIIDGKKYDPRKLEFWLNQETMDDYEIIPLFPMKDIIKYLEDSARTSLPNTSTALNDAINHLKRLTNDPALS